MGRPIRDLTGQRFGRLVVIEKTNKCQCSYIIWRCRCDCGNITLVNENNLVRKHTKSCGCLRINDLRRQRFGKLVVIKDSGERKKSGQIMWECKCDCGNITNVRGSHLRDGNIKSCGCLTDFNLIGKRFTKLVVIKISSNRSNKKKIMWECKCDCGNTTNVRSGSLRSGNTKSCGCLNRSCEGESKSRLYVTWQGMKARCYNINNNSYSYYGARGISICAEWREDFLMFREWATSHGYTDELTIHRKDKNGNYEPDNCVWLFSSDHMKLHYREGLGCL